MQTPVSLRNHTRPHQAVAGTQQFGHPQHRLDSRPMSRDKGLLRQGRNTTKCLYGLPAESPGRQRLSRKGKKQPKQSNKYTGGSWQTEEATRRASFRLSHVLSPQQGSSTAGSRLGGHTRTHITVTNPMALTQPGTSLLGQHTTAAASSQILLSSGGRLEMP